MPMCVSFVVIIVMLENVVLELTILNVYHVMRHYFKTQIINVLKLAIVH